MLFWSRYPPLLRSRNRVAKLFLYLEQRSGFADELHLVEDHLDELTQQGRLELRRKLLQEVPLARHRLGDDNVRFMDRWSDGSAEAQIVERPLRPHPERERSDLRATRVDVDTMEVVLQYQAWQSLVEGIDRKSVV